MKQLILLSASVFLFLSCNQSNKNNETTSESMPKKGPEAYNNFIVKLQSHIFEAVDNLDKAINNYEPTEMDKAFSEAKQTIEKSLSELKNLGGFEGDSSYKEAAQSFFETYNSLINNEYLRLINLFKLPDEDFGDFENQIVDSLDKIIATKQDSSFKKFWKIQVQFGKEYLKLE